MARRPVTSAAVAAITVAAAAPAAHQDISSLDMRDVAEPSAPASGRHDLRSQDELGRKAALTAHPAYRPNITRLKQAGATVLESEHSITVSQHDFSWTAIRGALGALPRQRPGRHRTVPG